MDFMDTPRLFDLETSISSDTSAAPGLEKDNTLKHRSELPPHLAAAYNQLQRLMTAENTNFYGSQAQFD
jgi:hypothetical protein